MQQALEKLYLFSLGFLFTNDLDYLYYDLLKKKFGHNHVF